jgi:hypothetical protein
MAAAEQASLRGALGITAKQTGSTVVATVVSSGIGHSFPTGVTDIREPWVELQAVDGQHKTLARYGGPAADGTIPASAARLGMDIASADGTLLLLHQLDQTTRIPLARFVPAGGQLSFFLDSPASLPAGAVGLDAVLLYRNVRTPYFRAATGDPTSSAPEVEIARVSVH